jgi:preprotein translocase subunit SecA
MLNLILRLILGSKNQRDLRRLQPIAEEINSLEPDISALADKELAAKTVEFKERLNKGETLDDLLPETFAVVREVGKRTIGLRHFDVQLMGGIVLHQGKIAEMKTGEGKTLVATLSAYLNALEGKGVHIVTVNDYLAKRDRYWMGPIFEFLGLKVGYIQHDLDNETRKEAYQCDITYVTNNEIGFDYLRDNMVVRKEDRVLRELNYAIVDEVDFILIDEARTPLIISGPAEESTDKYYIINRIVPQLKGKFISEAEEIDAKYKGIDLTKGYDYVLDEKAKNVTLTDQGIAKCERLIGVKNLYENIQSEWVHHISQALRAHKLFQRDVDYVVKDGQVVIVDEFTGRLMPGRRWSEGLHQAIEAKENLRIAEENQTLATITFQNFFRLYKKLAGMTGTALTSAEEFFSVYKLDVVVVPPNKQMIRLDYPDAIYKTEKEKDNAIINEIEDLWKKGQPVLVGTRSIEKSEKLSATLRRKGVPHNVLNAKYHEMEAQIIAQAGRKSMVTIATNMAGRGTDIILGGNPPDLEEQKFVVSLGGLHILGTERHEARRIDNQLRGRSGRQGDPGSSRFYLSLEDELMRLFGSGRIAPLMEKLGMQEGEQIEHPWISKAIEQAQARVEATNFDIRKQLLEYDNVMNMQREAIYALRNAILDGEDVSGRIRDMLDESIEEKTDTYATDKYAENWDLDNLKIWLRRVYGIELNLEKERILTFKKENLVEYLQKNLSTAYEMRENQLGKDLIRHLERMVLLQVIDTCWKEHLYDLDQLRKGIGLRAYGQKDPLIEYKSESNALFQNMMRRIREETLEYLFRLQIVPQPVRRATPVISGAPRKEKEPVLVTSGSSKESVNLPKKIGRNDPCPCGSGKKYKKCCGK